MVDFEKIEKRWQARWEKEKVFEVNEKSKKKKFYVLEMFPYPSGSGLHMGHAWNYTIGDIMARFKIMSGFNVLHPMGFDSLGLPAENAAIEVGEHPMDYTEKSLKNFIRQQKGLGLSYDWSRMVASHEPSYYKWDQWIFLKMLEKGLAYQKTSAVNWCPKCNSVLANEQVHGGKCWRHEDTNIEIRNLKQWFLKITDYADELYEGIEKLDWPERTKAMQRNWVGRSEGMEIDFEVERGEILATNFTNEHELKKKNIWSIFTTRPDTIFGVTFMVVSAQHPRLDSLVTAAQRKDVDKFLKKIGSVSQKAMKDVEELDKEGVFTGSYAVNPANDERVPIWVGNFVVADYGAGMVMAVPAHDQRDFEFAKKYGIEVRQVVAPFFKTEKGEDAIREDKKTEARNTAFAIVKHWKEDKYLCLNWGNLNWKSFVVGGVEKGESYEDAVIREAKEETGYQDIKSVKPINFEIHSCFFAKHKDVNRYGKSRAFLIELSSDKYKEPKKEDIKYHKAEWIEKDKVLDYLNLENNKCFWNEFINSGKAYTGSGILISSEEFNDVDNEKAKEKISDWLAKKNLARRVVNFKLRDWGISRQRYWGTPIPVVHCEKCGVVAVAEKDLPVELPKDVKFGKGNPLETNEDWLNVACPKCGGKARRESDTMDTFVNSSWYFLRYCDPRNDKNIFDEKKVEYWCPVDCYIGGAEHACMHLIYSRFYVKFLRDLGLLNFDEPAVRLFHQGMLHGEDGEKMSKSKGNGVLPEEVSEKYGIDTARFFLAGLASPDKDIDWSEKGINGSLKFIRRVVDFYENVKIGKDGDEILSKLNLTIKNVGNYIETFDYRPATIELRELFDLLVNQKSVSKKTLESALKLLSPFCPHICEEIWEKIEGKGFISLAKWPEFDESKILKNGVVGDLNSKIIEDIKFVLRKVDGNNVYVYVMPFELAKIDVGKICKEIGKDVKVFAVNNSKKYDPEEKAKRAKLGKAAIYLR